VVLHNVRGALNVDAGSGNLEIEGKVSESWQLQTGSGSIHLNVGNSSFVLNAETNSGSIQCTLPVTGIGRSGNPHISGIVGDGGPVLSVKTGSGDIHIQS
jgi:DUF4097 and DUF4098 domain-containing protein YvlB